MNNKMDEKYTYYTIKRRNLLPDEELNKLSARGWHLVSFAVIRLKDEDCLTGSVEVRDYAVYIFRSPNKD